MMSPQSKFSTLACLFSSSLLLTTPVAAVGVPMERNEAAMAATDNEAIVQKRLIRRTEAEESRPQVNYHAARTLAMMGMMNKKKASPPPEKDHKPDEDSGNFVEEGLRYYHDKFYHEDDNYYAVQHKKSSKGMGMMKKKKSGKGKGRDKGKGKGKGRSGKSGKGGYYYHDDYWYHAPTAAPEVVATFVQTVGCYSDESCVYSHNADFAAEYLLEETCRWTVTNDAILVVDYFDLEDGFDFLTVAGVGFTGTGEGLDGSPVFAGDELVFESDFLNAAAGFRVCLSNPV